MRKEPERRYRSVEQFAEDISRYLQGRPVIARPDTLAYRTGKFVRRNRLAIAAAVLVVASLTGGIVAFRLEAQPAERRFNQVRQLAKTVLFDINDQIADLHGSTKARQSIVRTGLEYLASLSADGRNDPDLQAELATAYKRIGDVQGNPDGPSL